MRVAYPAPTIHGGFKFLLFCILDRPVEGYPGHDFGMRKVSARAADFPDSIVRFLPMRLEELKQRQLHIPGLGMRLQIRGSRQMQGIHDFAIHVELKLP